MAAIASCRQTHRVSIDARDPQEALDIRRYAIGQGGIDDTALTPAAVERLKALGLRTYRFFVQEYFRMMEAPGRYYWESIDAMVLSAAATGAVPILSLAMKPACLYPAIDHHITEPSSWEHWDRFISDMVTHFARDLGLPGLWYEVGNEPDIGELGGCPYLFTADGYADYYAHTAKAVLRADPTAKVGGPALAGTDSERGGPITAALARRAQQEALPVDFYSWHTYDPAAENLPGRIAAARRRLVDLGPPLSAAPMVLDEWNISAMCSLQFGEFVQGAYVADAVARMVDARLEYSHYYHSMDITFHPDKFRPWFSPDGVEGMRRFWSPPFHGLHLMSPSGETAAAYVTFRMLYALEGLRLAVERPSHNVGLLAARTERGCRLLIWNYHHECLAPAELDLSIVGLPRGPLAESHDALSGSLMDAECGNLMRQGRMPRVSRREIAAGSTWSKTLAVAPHSVHLITVEA